MADHERNEVDIWHGSRGILAAAVILGVVVVGLILFGDAQGSLG